MFSSSCINMNLLQLLQNYFGQDDCENKELNVYVFIDMSTYNGFVESI